MKIVGLMPCRNEAWIVGLSARVALLWCDALVILNHASIDKTVHMVLDLFEEYPGRVFNMFTSDPVWDEMIHRQNMLEQARACGATHIALIDADEILTGNLIVPIREMIAGMPRGFCLQLPGYNLRNGIRQFHSSGIWGNRWFSVAFADDPNLHWAGNNFHQREPLGMRLRSYQPVAQRQGGVMHLWGASERRLKAKHAWFKITERLRWPEKRVEGIDQMYSWAIHGEGRNRAYGSPETWCYSPVPNEWWNRYADWMQYLDVDATPWQEAACREAIEQYGPEPFAKLDLFGVV